MSGIGTRLRQIAVDDAFAREDQIGYAKHR